MISTTKMCWLILVEVVYGSERFVLPTVRGDLVGYSSMSFPDVVTFTGVPYAVQPEGELRFRHTTVLESFPKPVLGSQPSLGFACPQANQTYGPDGEVYSQHEGCLFFQFALPRSFFTHNQSIAYALVTIHGGDFILGSSADRHHDYRRPTALDGVASFSMNYRLGVLGFLSDDPMHYNAGFRDQQLALEVISDVSRGLGVIRTLLAGQSAGAASVAAHLLVTPSGYDGVLMQSNPSGIRLVTPGEARLNWNTLFSSCGRSCDLSTLLSVQKKLVLSKERSIFGGHGDIIGLLPIGLVSDGLLLTSNLVKQYSGGSGRHDIPVMVGSTANETVFGVFKIAPMAVSPLLYPVISTALVGRGLGPVLRNRYPVLPSDLGDVRRPVTRLSTDWTFACGAHGYTQGNASACNIYYFMYSNVASCSLWGKNCVGTSCHSDDLLLFYNSSTLDCRITAAEMKVGTEWRRRAFGMLDGVAPWPSACDSFGDGTEISKTVQVGRVSCSFNRTEHSCDFWEELVL